jgi:hypothetical protein
VTKDYQFSNGDVVVTVPEKATGMLRAVSKPIGSPNMNPTGGDFQPVRVVINIVLEEESRPGVFLTDLNQSVTIRIRYSPADLNEAARSRKPLALGFWDGQRWVRFDRTKHQFNLQSDPDVSRGGFATVTITRWGDPPIAWGV